MNLRTLYLHPNGKKILLCFVLFLLLGNNLHAQPDLMHVMENGNVGIGISLPLYPLDISADQGVLRMVTTNHVNGSVIELKSTAGSPIFLGAINFNNTAGTFPGQIAYSGNNDLTLKTSGSERLRIMGNGNVGIGTTTPDDDLHVANHIRIGEDASFPNVFGELKHDGGSTGFIINANANGNWSDMYLQTDGNTRMFIESAGNVGIGTTTPLHKLTVVDSEFLGGVGVFVNTVPSQQDYGVYGACDNTDVFGYGGYFDGGYTGATGRVTPNVSNNSNYYYGLSGDVSTETAHSGNGTNMGVCGQAEAGNINYGLYGNALGGPGTIWNIGVYGHAGGNGTNYAGVFEGNVDISGTLSKASGSFKIDHPLDPSNKNLYHSFVESPDMMNIYNGNVVTNANGEAIVKLPDYFEPLNKEFRYQLTAVGAPGPNLHIAEKISGNHFRIAGGEAGMEVSWQVTGIRQDAFANAHRIQVEEDKLSHERGKYLHPEVFGIPREMGVDYRPEYEAEMKRMREHHHLHDERRAKEKKAYMEN